METNVTQTTSTTKRSTQLPNILAIVGFLILIIIVVWGLIHLASLSSGWFGNLFKTKHTTTISITAPNTVVSGNPTQIKWNYTTTDVGSYSFLYECGTGVEFGAPVDATHFARIPCGAAFKLGAATSSAYILPVLTATSSTKTNMTVLFIPSGTGKQAQGVSAITVTPRIATSTPVATKPTETIPADTTPVVRGPADLSVHITSISIDAYGNGTAVFDIANIGGTSTGTWYFTAQLPTQTPYTYSSPAQAPLAPGSHIVNTLNFTQAASGNFYVNVSPVTGEASTNNNTALQYVTVGGYQYGY
jgi:hypothetical protein